MPASAKDWAQERTGCLNRFEHWLLFICKLEIKFYEEKKLCTVGIWGRFQGGFFGVYFSENESSITALPCRPNWSRKHSIPQLVVWACADAGLRSQVAEAPSALDQNQGSAVWHREREARTWRPESWALTLGALQPLQASSVIFKIKGGAQSISQFPSSSEAL